MRLELSRCVAGEGAGRSVGSWGRDGVGRGGSPSERGGLWGASVPWVRAGQYGVEAAQRAVSASRREAEGLTVRRAPAARGACSARGGCLGNASPRRLAK